MFEAESVPLPAAQPLSPRELEVLGMVAAGMTNPQIADRLQLTTHAVKFHLASVFRKLRVSNRTEAAVAFLSASREPADPSPGGTN